MIPEDSTTPVPVPRSEDPVISAGLEIAIKWGQALGGPDQLKIALEAVEPQLRREHQLRRIQLETQAKKAEMDAQTEREKAQLEAEARKAELEERIARERRHHTLRMTSLIVGAVLALGMLSGGVYVAPDSPWLASVLCGPSLIGMTLIIVLRRHDAHIMKGVGDAARRAMNAATQNQQPPPPPPPAV
ncbi:hypothetical protein GCM10018777_08120 [Streptomyces albogriseolus]|uniref:hypothetical protein n=1 Tax=Streptomyces albogriseolus TaxID=1887 RepID=UPI001672F483|nr:hypothetical protein [Streptomyces viridodiastaticus]GHF99965.1 hypothetical protein GCM10018777_08120 [Streptomyces viridodiastaticus]